MVDAVWPLPDSQLKDQALFLFFRLTHLAPWKNDRRRAQRLAYRLLACQSATCRGGHEELCLDIVEALKHFSSSHSTLPQYIRVVCKGVLDNFILTSDCALCQ